eukprot:CAMPEP_0185263906 /NCGR_PEP_ID=MMETSP1359-20130426/16955_1 /TAXON_ID=552665 /ORGANISM="Bigelowiella longifila, Strain CCMP242" /LENGTH=143 /DNA_ID=CAMNT_0027851791 /DNA_START=26 /DNA_END=457 /DNA_ORIENTATION=+
MKFLFATLFVIATALCFFIHKSNGTIHSLSHVAPISAQRTRGVFVPMRASLPELRRSLRACADGEPAERKPGQPDQDGFVYADEVQKVERKKPKMSKEQMRRLRDEYVGVGGAQNTAMPNYFLYISLLVATLSIISKFLGYLD